MSVMRIRSSWGRVTLVGALFLAACTNTSRPIARAGQWNGPGAYAGPVPWGPQQIPLTGAPQNGAPQNGTPQYGTFQAGPGGNPAQNLPPVYGDPINNLDFRWMRQRAAQVLGELVASLPPYQRARVEGIPMVTDDKVGEINAFAGCNDGTAFMAVSDGLLEVLAYSSRLRATDTFFGSQKLDGYTKMVVENAHPDQPLPRPQASFFDPNQDADGRKVAAQQALFDGSLAFVMGHELGHHYLGHTGCANGGVHAGISPGDIGRFLSNRIPVFNQPNEIAADTVGTYSMLTVGSRRQTNRFGEEGAMLVLNFFVALDSSGPGNLLLRLMESTHPDPRVRIPIVQNAANVWRQSGGNPPPVFGY